MIYRKVLIGALVLCLSVVASESVVLATRLEPWTGLIDQDIVRVLPELHTQADEPWPFVVGILDGAAQYDSFRTSSGDAQPSLTTDPDIDWQSERMLFAIWPMNTNDVGLASWETPTDGTGTLNLSWSGIEPFYLQRFPALIHTVSRQGLTDVAFVLDGADVLPGFQPIQLAVVAIPEPASMLLLWMALLGVLVLVTGQARLSRAKVRGVDPCGD